MLSAIVGNLRPAFIAQHGPRKTLARLQIVQQALQHDGGGFDVFYRRRDIVAVGGQHIAERAAKRVICSEKNSALLTAMAMDGC